MAESNNQISNQVESNSRKEEDKPILSVEIRSAEIQDIIGAIPGNLVQFGSVSILFLFLAVVAGSAFISYPEMLSAQIVVTTTAPPIKIVSGTTGVLKRIRFKEGQNVQQGDILAVIDNASNYQDVFRLKQALISKDSNVTAMERFALGELSEEASRYFDSQKKMQLFLKLHLLEDQRIALTNQVRNYGKLRSDQFEQFELLSHDVEITIKDFERNQKLLKEGVLAPQQFEAKEKELLSTKRALAAAKQAIRATDISINELQKNIKELELKQHDELGRLEQAIDYAIQTLSASIIAWEKKYLLISPINGSISFTAHWSEGQHVEQNESVFWIVPNSTSVIGKVKLAIRKSAKVKAGQEVRIKLENYPFEEYGILLGRVENVSALPTDQAYLIDVKFPQGLVTTYQKQLDFHQQMQGTASIVIDNMSLLERIFYQFRRLYESR